MTTILDEFEQDLQPSTLIPHCQVINPPNMAPSQIEKVNPPYGIFLPLDKAEEVGFAPSSDWDIQEVEFGEGRNASLVQGYLAKHCRMAVVHRSGIEVEGLDSMDKYYYLGLAYERGQITEIGQQAKNSPKVGTRSMFRTRTRMLVFFLDENNNLLHANPLKLTSRGGFGGSFGNELREYYNEVDRVFGKLKKKSGMKLSPSGLARVAIDFQLGYHKGEGTAPFTCIKSRLAPAIDQVGVSKLVERRGYEVNLTGAPIESLLISSTTEEGQIIMSAYKVHEKFPLPNQGQIVKEAEPEEIENEDPVSGGWDGEF
ncbi:MAG TPA: DUF5895 domain-containing protein [Allocoleopsis sp.]